MCQIITQCVQEVAQRNVGHVHSRAALLQATQGPSRADGLRFALLGRLEVHLLRLTCGRCSSCPKKILTPESISLRRLFHCHVRHEDGNTDRSVESLAYALLDAVAPQNMLPGRF